MENPKINLKSLYHSLDQLLINGIFSKADGDKIKKLAEVIARRIRGNERPTVKEGQQVEEVASMMLKTAINKPVTPDFKKLADGFMALIRYWDDKVGGQSELKNSISTVQRFVDYHLTVLDVIMVLRELLPKIERMQNFNPPAFELSRHYLESLESLSGKKGGSNKKKNPR